MTANPLPLRDYQLTDLSRHIAMKKDLNTSHPGTGKTPTVCMLAYYHWATRQKRTVWAMPLSLMKQNKRKMLAFTGFETADVDILASDHAPLTKKWTGPTKLHKKSQRSLRVRVLEPRGSGLARNARTHMKALEPLVVITRVIPQGLCMWWVILSLIQPIYLRPALCWSTS